jgi:hypothetical protein
MTDARHPSLTDREESAASFTNSARILRAALSLATGAFGGRLDRMGEQGPA